MPCEMCGGEVDELTAGRCNRCKNWKKMCKSLWGQEEQFWQ